MSEEGRMMQGKKKYFFRYEDMARIRGVGIHAVYMAAQRGDFVRGDLESMWRWSLCCKKCIKSCD